MKISILYSVILLSLFSCVSTKSTLKNVDNTALSPRLLNKTSFIISEKSTDIKYGYDKNYPINVFYNHTKYDSLNQQRFFSALAGPNGEVIKYKKIESCCPFPTKNTEMGVGTLDIYEVTWDGQKEPIRLYLNYFEKGKLMIPVGFTVKKI